MKPIIILILKIQYIGELNLILPMKSFLRKLIDQEKNQSFWITRQQKVFIYLAKLNHKVQMAVDEGGNIISLIKNYDDSCKVFLVKLGCLFPSDSSLSSILHFLFLISVIGLMLLQLLLLCKCYTRCIKIKLRACQLKV